MRKKDLDEIVKASMLDVSKEEEEQLLDSINVFSKNIDKLENYIYNELIYSNDCIEFDELREDIIEENEFCMDDGIKINKIV